MIRPGLFILIPIAITGLSAYCGESKQVVAKSQDTQTVAAAPKTVLQTVEKDNPTDTTAPASTITWLDFESGYAKAAKENKILLIDVYTDWCGWCKVMDRETYTNAEVIQAVNKDFVTVKLNPEKNRTYKFGDKSMAADELHAWLGYGRTFGYPTTYFMMKPGSTEERYSQAGYLEAPQFMKILTIVLGKKS
ncbi:MAG: DUF255 domain-containing protein [Bacteroidetes bacterium]|nr:DUF255 domain-containing protein [Bacteroidota bacterium]